MSFAPMQVIFCFYAELNDFLPPERGMQSFPLKYAASTGTIS